MSSRLLLPCAAACLSVALASCGGGGGASSTTASAEPPALNLLAWNHGRVTNWVWYANPETLPDDDEFQTGIVHYDASNDDRFSARSAAGDFSPTDRLRASMSGLLSTGNRLRDGHVSWGDPVNGFRLFLATDSDADYIRQADWNAWRSVFDATGGLVRNIMAHGQYSAFLQHGVYICRNEDCSSQTFRAAIWGQRNHERQGGDTAFDWLRSEGASASWRGAMAGSAVASGVAVVGEAAVSYSVSDDSVGVEFTNVEQRDDGTGVIDATYIGPNSFTWTLTGQDDSHSDYWVNDENGEYGVDVRFYGPDAQEAAGTFEAAFADAEIEGGKDRLVGGFVAKR